MKQVEKLKTNIINSKKEKRKFMSLLIIAVVGIILTAIIQMSYLKENNIIKRDILSHSYVGIGEADRKKAPRLPEGFRAVNKKDNKYEIVNNPYNTNNFANWDKTYYAVDSANILWKWIPAFKYRTEYYKNEEYLGSAKASAVYDKDNKEMDSKEFEKLIADATHFKHSTIDIEKEDETYGVHPAFTKNGFIEAGFWVSLTTQEIDPETNPEFGTYGKIYDEVKKIYENPENNSNINLDMTGVNILNPYEFGALSILENSSMFLPNVNNGETKNEVILGYLKDGILTNGSLLDTEYKNGKDSIVQYPKSETNTAESNFEKAMLTRQMYGDGFSETRGLLNKETNTKNVEPADFLTNEKAFLILNKSNEGVKVKAFDGKLPLGEKTDIRLVLNIKPTTIDNKIKFTFLAEGGKFTLANGQQGNKLDYSQSKGALITDEKLAKNIPNPTKEDFEFLRWEPDPTGNIYYKETVFKAVWKEKTPIDNENIAIARFYHSFEPNSEYTDIKVPVGERIGEHKIREIEEKLKAQNKEVLRWAPDPKGKILKKGIYEFKPILKSPTTDEREIAFTFYKNANLEEWITIKAKFDIKKSPEGIAPNEVEGLQEKLKEFAPNDGTNSKYEWVIDLNKKQLTDTEYIPRFIKEDEPEIPPEERVSIYINYNGSKYGDPREKEVIIKRGTRLTDPINKAIYEEMTSDLHYKRNYELPSDKNKWFTPSLDTVINDTTTFKMNWNISYITVRFWNAPEEYDGKKIIKEQRIPSGTKPELPDNSAVLPFIEIKIPGVDKPIKRSFSKEDGWRQKSVYKEIYTNDLNVKKIDGKFILDAYPIFQSQYIEPYEKVKITFNLNIPAGEEGNIYFPDKESFKDREVEKGSILYAPYESEYPRIAGWSLKGFEPELPLTVNKDETITLIWQKNKPYVPINPGPTEPDDPLPNSKPNNEYWEKWDPFKPKDPEGKSDTREIEIVDPNSGQGKIDKKTPVKVDTGLKTSKSIIFIGAGLTTIIIFSYVRIVSLNKQVKRNQEELKNIW